MVPGQPEIQAPLDQLVPLESQAPPGLWEQLGILAPQDPLVTMVLWDFKEQQGPRGRLETPDNKASQDLWVPMELQARLVTQETLEPLVQRARPGQLVRLEVLVVVGHLDQLVLPGRRVHKELPAM